MSRIAATFAALKAQNRKALIPYVTAGFPYADITPELMHGMVAGGADVIELGVPFSDPSADGPVIQKAGDQALAMGIGLAQVLEMVRVFRLQDDKTPVVLMGYANPSKPMTSSAAKTRLCAMRPRPAWTACWWLTTRPRNVWPLPPPCAATAWT